MPRLLAPCLLVAALGGSPVLGQAAPPGAHENVAFDVMNVLSRAGLHDLEDERWNAYGQTTYISSWKLPFTAPYTNLNGSTNSLLPGHERSFTWSATLFLGARLWPGGEAYFVPEVIAERPLSTLHGLGGAIQNFELQKGGSETPQVYRARLYLRQVIGLGGEPQKVDSNPMQLGTTVDRRRIVIWGGNFSVLDVMDKNGVTGICAETFLNMAFMTHASWDFMADARGYTYGAAVEWYWDDWAVRFAHTLPPKNPNQLPVDFRFWQYFGDQAGDRARPHPVRAPRRGATARVPEPGDQRLLRRRDCDVPGRPDEERGRLCGLQLRLTERRRARPVLGAQGQRQGRHRPGREQLLAKDIGVFLRAMWSDGQTEVVAFNAADRSLSFGAVARGSLWNRPFDVTGIGLGLSWISESHARYLALGGIDGFIGDGALRQATEGVFELFYSLNLFQAIRLSGDFQLLWNPGYNADRGGPVAVVGARVHAEF